MNQRTHAWIAIRAIKLLMEEGSVPDLVKLLLPFTKKAAIGAWIPDKTSAKIGGSKTQNHIFKIGPYKGTQELKSRFIVEKTKTLEFLGPLRLSRDFIDKRSNLLDSNWWSQPYKAEPNPGQHLANRAMSLSINNIDMLMLGNQDVQMLVPGRIDFIDKISNDTKISQGQVALFFFMLSHFVADAIMPCHCDDRDLSDYDHGKLHKQLEGHWSKKIGTSFDEKNLLDSESDDNKILENSIEIDIKYDIKFGNSIPTLEKKDIWDTVVRLCRASFAIASIIAPFDK